MKRFLIVFVCCISVLFMGCSETPNETDVTSSFFADSYSSNAVNEFVDRSESADISFDNSFLYEDICFSEDEDISATDFQFTAEAAAVFCVDDSEVLYSHNLFEKVYPASLTKLMTALVAVRYGELDSTAYITEDNCGINTAGAQLCGFKAGDSITMHDLLYCLLVFSGNDAAKAIAEAVAGTESAFVKMMNEEAERIGAFDSHFMNPHGLQDVNHYTTAYDMYLIFNECLKYVEIKDIFCCSGYDVEIIDASGVSRTLYVEPTNLYFHGLYEPPTGITVFGGKTGSTIAAGNCLIILSSDSDGKSYITELYKTETRDILYSEMNELLKVCK